MNKPGIIKNTIAVFIVLFLFGAFIAASYSCIIGWKIGWGGAWILILAYIIYTNIKCK